MGRPGYRLWAAALVALVSAHAARASDAPPPKTFLPQEAASFLGHLLPASELTRSLDIELRFDHAMYRFRRGEARAEVHLSHPSTCATPDGPLCVTVANADGPGGEALARDARTALASALRASAGGPRWVVETPRDTDRTPAGGPGVLRDVGSWRIIADTLLVLLLEGIVLGLWRSRGRIVSRDAIVPACLTVLALGLRFAAHPGPSDIRAVLYDVGPRRAGWDALLSVLYAVFPARDETIWNVNRVVGALSVPLLYAVVRRRFVDPIVAVGAAATLAVTPLLVRFSASDTPYVVLCAALLGAVIAYDAYAESESIGTWILALGLLTAAMQLRPDALWLIVPAALLAIAGRRARLSRPGVVVTALAFLAINAVPAAWAITGHAEGHDLTRHFVLFGALIGSPWADVATTPRMLAGLVVFGAMTTLYRRRRAEILWVVATALALPADTPATGDYANLGFLARWAFVLPQGAPLFGDTVTFHQYANARYHIPAMYLACGLAGLGAAGILSVLARLLRRPVPAARLVAVGLVCGAALPRIDLLQRMWTPQSEFDFFRRGLARVDPACRVATLLDVIDAGFVPFDYLAQHRLVDVADVLDKPSRDGCLVYYRCGNCFTLDLVPRSDWLPSAMHPRCRAVEDRFRLAPIIEAQIPALPFRSEIYSRDPLPLGFYRLLDRQ